MAHNNVELLNDFIQQILRYDKADIFVHVDKKAENMIPQIKKAGRIHILNSILMRLGEIIHKSK